MKRLLLWLGIIAAIGLLGYLLVSVVKNKVVRDLAQPVAYPSVTTAPTRIVEKKGITQTSLFVPYWTLKKDISETYDTYIYFGVSAREDGSIDYQEAGAINADAFVEKVPDGKKKLLTLRMINNQSNLAIIKDPAKQKKIVAETIQFAQKHEFDGIVLDLEITAIPFDSLIKQITSFTELFAMQVRKNDIASGVALYGDTFYRIRPFDVKTIAGNFDEVFIMTYDFHKSNGNPGPNFPRSGKDVYGYSIEKMSDDFLKFVPAQKLTVIFGLYGYDWVVDSQGKSLQRGEPLTHNEIKLEFISDCRYTHCSVKRDDKSSETQIRYTDEFGKQHIIWFEDMKSVSEKQKGLQEKGISSFSFWANSYF